MLYAIQPMKAYHAGIIYLLSFVIISINVYYILYVYVIGNIKKYYLCINKLTKMLIDFDL